MENRLRVARAEKGINQTLTARAIGMGRDRLLRIEKQYAEPTKDEMSRLANFFGWSVRRLFPGTKPKPAPTSTDVSATA